MLVDLPQQALEARDELMELLMGGAARPERLSEGHYLAGLNWNHAIDRFIKDEYPFSPEMNFSLTQEERMEAVREWYKTEHPSDYGVCDTPEQVVAKWPELLDDERPFIIAFTIMRKADQSPRGGWRWHKWGEYIGTKNPQHEYLYDEDDSITEVYCFHIYEVQHPIPGNTMEV